MQSQWGQAEIEIIQILRNELLARKAKNARYSLRSFARQLGMPVPVLSQLLNGKRNLTPHLATQILASSKVPADKKHTLLKAVPMRKRGPKALTQSSEVLQYVAMSAGEYSILSEWWHFAILSLIDSGWTDANPESISKNFPSLTITNVKRSLKTLQHLDMLKVDGSKVCSTGRKFETTTDVSNALIQAFHRQGCDLAKDALKIPVAKRDFSALTVTCSPEKLPELKKRIQDFRRGLSDVMEKSKGKTVYRLQVQLFPLSKEIENEN